MEVLKFNLIIKFHHYHYYLTKNKKIIEIEKKKNCYLYKSSKFFNKIDGDDFIKFSDIIITDTSGVATAGIFLNKKMIFLNPVNSESSDNLDIDLKLRPGFICDDMIDLKSALSMYIKKNMDPYVMKKKEFNKKIFYTTKKSPARNISNFLKYNFR